MTALSVEPVTVGEQTSVVAASATHWVAELQFTDAEVVGECLFFNERGQDNTLPINRADWRREGGFLIMDAGSGLIFRGRDGETIELTRVRAPTNRLAPTWRDFDGAYSYEECPARGECSCAIRAHIFSTPIE